MVASSCVTPSREPTRRPSGASWPTGCSAARAGRHCWTTFAAPSREATAVTVYLVGAGPGDPGLLTVRGAELLGRADLVVFDRLAEPSLLALAPAGAELVDVGKEPGGPVRQDEINR